MITTARDLYSALQLAWIERERETWNPDERRAYRRACVEAGIVATDLGFLRWRHIRWRLTGGASDRQPDRIWR